MHEDCVFCRIAAGELPVEIIAQSAHGVAFRDNSPKAPVHCLVIPRVHVESLDKTDSSEMLGDLLLLAANVARAEGIAESGYRLVANTNEDGGQAVFHLHFHVLGGRRMSWPPG